MLESMMRDIEEKLGQIIKSVEWVSIGGGIKFKGEDYKVDEL